MRPASKLVAALAGFNADLVLEKNGKCVTPDSLNQIALLQVRRHDKLRLLARGPDADAALAAFQALAADGAVSPRVSPRTLRICWQAVRSRTFLRTRILCIC